MSPAASRLQVFGPATPLEPGITLLEASAGTGKTYQITNLVLRLVLEQGLRLPQILVVTFTHAATAELKDRIRRRIAAAQRALETGRADAHDALLQRVVAEAAEGAESAARLRKRARQAREDLDQALISTIHGFCQRMLQLGAFESGTAFGRELVTDEGPAIAQAVDDLLVARLHGASPAVARVLRGMCGWTQSGLARLGRLALADPDLPLVPAESSASPEEWLARVAALRQEWAAACEPGGPVATLTALVADKKKAFDGRTYSARYAAQRREQLAAWLADPSTLPGPDETWVRWFSPEQLSEKARSPEGQALAAAPFFARWWAVVEEAPAVVTGARIGAVRALRTALARHHRRENSQTFHDLLRDLDHTLRHPDRGPALAATIRSRFQAALIDEFQDTDALQWRIFGQLFGSQGALPPAPEHFLYLIGDPKQAIYGFRGANVHVYLQARDAAPPHRRFTMDTNYRSDAELVAAMNHLLDRQGLFGSGDIQYVKVRAHHPARRLVGGAEAAPLQLVWVDGTAGGEGADLLGNGPLQELLPEVCATELVELLSDPPRIQSPGGAERPLVPGDVAVLVRGHAQAGRVHAALRQRQVPAVIASQGSVFSTGAATSLSRWLGALDASGGEGGARLLAVDPLLGATVRDLPGVGDEAADERWSAWLDTLRWWRRTVGAGGVMAGIRALLRTVPPWAEDRRTVQEAVLAGPDGERRMTDLLHLAELLHGEALASGRQLSGLRLWLDRQRLEEEDAPEAAELRLERDDEAVQIITVHRSKGLQYPVVYVPFAWGDEGARVATPLIAARPGDSAARDLVLACSGPSVDLAVEAQARESREESMRLLYVALTRAVHRCVVFWPGVPAPSRNGSPKPRAYSALAAALHGAAPGGTVDDRIAAAPERASALEPEEQREELRALAAGAAGCLALRSAGAPTDVAWTPPRAEVPVLRARRLGRPPLADGWRRHSYSAMTRADLAAHHEELVDPVRGLGFDDDRVAERPAGELPGPPALSAAELSVEDVPLAGFPAGADAGTCLHAVFEFLDFPRAVDPDDEGAHLGEVVHRQLQAHGFGEASVEKVLLEGVPGVLQTPLGPLLPERCLADVPLADRLDELRFDLPIAGGSRDDGPPVAPLDLRDALALRDPADERVPRAWIERVGELGFAPLRGFLTGSIDLVFRVPDERGGRWFVVDYKSNRLDHERLGRTVPAAFSMERMRHEMALHHYFLQYHLYTLALHRFLGLRLGADYRYERHMGGVMYLFVRGMTGPEAVGPEGVRGVFSDRPPVEVIEALDELFGLPEVG
jgi:exodeoxyribonuclease V beta subunit